MLGMFDRLLGRSSAPQAVGPFETFGKVDVSRAFGEELLQATTERRSRVRAIRDRMEYMSKEEKVHLIDRVFLRFALYVFDLPASERHHHARPFGLLDHSIEVAWKTVLKLSETSFRVSPDPLENHKERPAWIYCGLLAALGHDAGKVLDCEVVLFGGKDRWRPEEGPLAEFCVRHGLRETGSDFWRFREGRGEHGHKGHAREILSRILTPEASRNAGHRLDEVFQHYAPWPTGEKPVTPPDPLRSLLEVVRHYDKESARRDYEARKAATSPTLGAKPQLGVEPPDPRASELSRREEVAPAPVAITDLQNGVLEASLPDSARPRGEVTSQVNGIEATEVAEGEDEAGPIFSRRQGDPGEVGRRLEVEFEPAKLLDTLQRMILARRLHRNGLFSPVYVRPDYVWVLFPRAFRKLAHLMRLPFDRRVQYRCRRVIAELSGVVPLEPETPLIPIQPPGEMRVVQAIRIRSRSLFTEVELSKLGYADHEISVRPGEYRSLVAAGKVLDL